MGLDTVEFLIYAEKSFDIKISDAEAGEIYTMGQFSRLCHKKILAKGSNTSESEVFAALCKILHKKFAIQKPIHREDLIVKDLGLE